MVMDLFFIMRNFLLSLPRYFFQLVPTSITDLYKYTSQAILSKPLKNKQNDLRSERVGL